MKTILIKEWGGKKPGEYDLPETMVARLKKHGFAKDPEPPKPVKKVVVEPKKKAKTKKEKVTYENKSLKDGTSDK
jgi:hypothetical protein